MNSNRSDKLNKDKIFFWAADFNTNSGEGRLGRLFIEDIRGKLKNKIIMMPRPKIYFLNHKYVLPFVGIFFCWVYFFRRKKVIYLNYLPYWNFLIFLLLPPKTTIGPITGGALFNKGSKDYYIRKFIFPSLYCLSNLILKIRFEKCIFSTDLLEKYLPKKIKDKSKFNFVLKALNKNKKHFNKNIDFLFYYRKHRNKKTFFPIHFVKRLIESNYKVRVVGDKIKINGIKNLGYIPFKKMIYLLKKTKYTVVSRENIFSFFIIDAINNNVKILIDHKNYKLLKYNKNNFVKFNFQRNSLKKFK